MKTKTTTRTADVVAAELASVQARHRALADRAQELSRTMHDLAEAASKLYADGAETAEIMETDRSAREAGWDLAAVAGGLAQLETRAAALDEELKQLRRAEAAERLSRAVEDFRTTVDGMAIYLEVAFSSDTTFSKHDAAIRRRLDELKGAFADVQTTAAAAGMSAPVTLPTGVADAWRQYPGLIQVLEAINQYRAPMLAAERLTATAADLAPEADHG